MRLGGGRSRRSFSQRDFRTQRMLSQDEVPHNSFMLRSSQPLVPRGHAKLVSPFSGIWLGLDSNACANGRLLEEELRNFLR
jgi:hypothetical protein